MPHDILVWVSFFGPPLFIVLLTIFVFRPSARHKYHEAKQVIFSDRGNAGRSRENRSSVNHIEA